MEKFSDLLNMNNGSFPNGKKEMRRRKKKYAKISSKRGRCFNVGSQLSLGR